MKTRVFLFFLAVCSAYTPASAQDGEQPLSTRILLDMGLGPTFLNRYNELTPEDYFALENKLSQVYGLRVQQDIHERKKSMLYLESGINLTEFQATLRATSIQTRTTKFLNLQIPLMLGFRYKSSRNFQYYTNLGVSYSTPLLQYSIIDQQSAFGNSTIKQELNQQTFGWLVSGGLLFDLGEGFYYGLGTSFYSDITQDIGHGALWFNHQLVFTL